MDESLHDMDYPVDRNKQYQNHPGRAAVHKWIERSYHEYQEADGKSPRQIDDRTYRSKQQIIGDILSQLKTEHGGQFKRKKGNGCWFVVSPRDAKRTIAYRFSNLAKQQQRRQQQQHKNTATRPHRNPLLLPKTEALENISNQCSERNQYLVPAENME